MKKIYAIEGTYINNEIAPIQTFYENEQIAKQVLKRIKENNEKSFTPLYKNFRIVEFPLNNK